MNKIKVVFVGDGGVGKTSLLVTYSRKEYLEGYPPTIDDCEECNQQYEGESFTFSLWDTLGWVEYDRIRPLSYLKTDVFLICYSINDRISFENVKLRWLPEIQNHVGNVPFIIVSTKNDLRYDPNLKEIDNNHFIVEEEGLEMAISVGAFDFIEISSKTNVNVDTLFDHVIEIYKHKQPLRSTKRKQKGCFIC